MGSISLRNVGVVAQATLFQNLNLVVQDGDRVGLVAGNGRGKTTLLRCLAGSAETGSGEITRSRGLTVALAAQDAAPAMLQQTPLEALLAAIPAAERESSGWRAEMLLDEFAVPAEMRERPIATLSGGWQRLLLIAAAWIGMPDLLLLDEPTNHLDLAKVMWLEQWLAALPETVALIVASHDRAFLDAVTNRTLFLRPETSRYFALGYGAARAALDEADAADANKLERDLKDAKQLRKQAAKLTNIGINSGSDLLTVKAKYLKERAAKIEEQARPVHRERSGEVRLASREGQSRVVFALEELKVTVPDGRVLFSVEKLHVFQGDRVVLLGRNGAGKTRLVDALHRAMLGETVPGIRTAPSLVLGYLDQHMTQLPPEATPTEIIGAFGVGDARVRSLIAAAGLPIEKQGRPIRELSLGQRSRLGLLALRLTEPSFYLLDEPTNHIDIAGQEALEEEILKQNATALVISHDRSFVRAVGTRFLLIDGKRLKEIEGPEPFFAMMAEEAS